MKKNVWILCLVIGLVGCKKNTTVGNAAPAEIVTPETIPAVVNTGDISIEPAMDQQGKVAVTSDAKPKIHEKNGNIDWYEIQSALNYSNPEGKMYFVDVYTDWCGWCKVMDKKTFSDPRVQKAMNERFHMVKFNAEQKENITFNGQQFNWIDAGRNGINTFAVKLLGEEMGFPSYVYLDKNKKPITTTAGYQEVEKFLQTLAQIK